MLRQIQTTFTQLYQTLLGPTPTIPIVPNAPVTKRARTSYKSNITASLMLPEIYCEIPKKKLSMSESSGFLSWLTPWWPKNILTWQSPVNELEYKKKTESKNDDLQCIPLRQNIKDLEQERKQAASENLQATILEKEVDLNARRIQAHAAFRVDLFFYLLVAVYKTYHSVVKDKTIKQHGKGSKDLNTQACHSSLFSNIALIPNTNGLNAWSMFTPIKKRQIKGTQFEESLNLTVELPNIVNAFDGHLEGRYQPTKYVQQLLTLLQQTSMGTITPKEAMLGFFKIMNVFFGQMEQRLNAEENSNNLAMKKVCQYEKEGTFLAANTNLSLKEEYLHLMLRLSGKEITAAKCSNKVLDHFYLRIQEEIYQNKSVLATNEEEEKNTQTCNP